MTNRTAREAVMSMAGTENLVWFGKVLRAKPMGRSDAVILRAQINTIEGARAKILS